MVTSGDRLGRGEEGIKNGSGFLLSSVLADKTPKAIALGESPLTNF